MKLKEVKTKDERFYIDEHGKMQGEYTRYTDDGRLYVREYRVDNRPHGEYQLFGRGKGLGRHTYRDDCHEIIDFLKNPELYPTTEEDKTAFALTYGHAYFLPTI